jgi:hypothetical protein
MSGGRGQVEEEVETTACLTPQHLKVSPTIVHLIVNTLDFEATEYGPRNIPGRTSYNNNGGA